MKKQATDQEKILQIMFNKGFVFKLYKELVKERTRTQFLKWQDFRQHLNKYMTANKQIRCSISLVTRKIQIKNYKFIKMANI